MLLLLTARRYSHSCFPTKHRINTFQEILNKHDPVTQCTIEMTMEINL